MKKDEYKNIVSLLLEILPSTLQDQRVALKGGTAINLFHRNFPRLSVDIDLCYLPLENRETTFKGLHNILKDIKETLEKKFDVKVNSSNPLNGKKETKLVVIKDNIEIKIEPNFILRSSLFPTIEVELAKNAISEFAKNVKARCLSLADCYGGKICAALDRQHPRDLFDIKCLFENEGITTEIKDSFIFYLISHNRPINELLNPNFKELDEKFINEFAYMSQEKVELETLMTVRSELVGKVRTALTDKDKDFLISFIQNKPDWTLVRESKIQEYPSVKWKMFNQSKMDSKKISEYVKNVEQLFS